MGSTGLKSIVKALKENPSITKLSLTENKRYIEEWRNAKDLVEANEKFQAALQVRLHLILA